MTEEIYNEEDIIPFIHPCTVVIAGSTQSGKTHFVTNMLLHSSKTFSHPIQRLVYCYGTYLKETFIKLKQSYPNIELINGIDDSLQFNSDIVNCLIIDDLMTDAVKSSKISDLFTKGYSHSNLTIILLTQNIFQQGIYGRTININAHYMIYFKNPRNTQQIGFLARQMYRDKSNALIEAYDDAVIRPFSYLFIDFKQRTPEKLRLKTNVLPTDPQPCIVYIPK